jgi:transcription elongation factor Elf1
LRRIGKERATRIAKSHACERCGEYSYKRVSVKPATRQQNEQLGISWAAEKVCGVCDAHLEMGINDEGDIVYAN